MAEKVPATYKIVELVGVSSESYAAAAKNAVSRANDTLRGLTAIELDADYWYAYNNRGLALWALGRRDEARADYAKVKTLLK